MFAPFSRWFRRYLKNKSTFQLGLSFKLYSLLALASAVGILFSSSLVLTLQRQHFVDDALKLTTRQSRLVNASLEQAMLRNDQVMLDQIVQAAVDQQSIEHIRILDNKGIVHTSSMPTDIGKRLDYTNPTCLFCHTDGERPSNQSTIFTSLGNHETLVNVHVIYNMPQCQSCHDVSDRVLGLTVIEMPMTDLNKQLELGFWRILIAAIFTLVLMVPLFIMAMQRLIFKPIQELTRGMTEIRSGNLDYELGVNNHDELGTLTDAFNVMRNQLKATRAENDTLYKNMHTLAVLKERDRLAGELHDNLAQMLGFINIKAALTDDFLVRNQIDAARNHLLELKNTAKEAYTDVRESIFYLRHANSSGDDLISDLNTFLTEYRTKFGIDARLFVEDECLAEFPSEVQVQVNRIIQEALTNVRKHSGAKQAWVRFERVNHHVRIGIEDDGKGFDPSHLEQSRSKHFGLQIMRERAESVGGELVIDSQLGSGTRVALHVPIFPMIEDPHENTTYFAG
jgi:signal transduction histidine kinase